VSQIENVARLGGLSPERKFPFLAPEKCGAATFTFCVQVGRHAVWIESHPFSRAWGDKKVPVKKASSRRTTKAKASGGPNSFGHFVRNLRGVDPVLAPFKAHAAANVFPHVDSWAEIRSYLFRTGAQHEAVVGARIAWREFQSR